MLDIINATGRFVKGLHSIGDLDPQRRFIMHFPQDDLVMSIGSGYGGNALLGKKCISLRIASYLGYRQGWLAEHMIIMGVQKPGRRYHLSPRLLSVRLRQDEPRHARPRLRRLQGMDPRRRHRLDKPGAGRQALRDKPGGGLFRRRARHLRQDEPEHDEDAQGGQVLPHPFHEHGARHRYERALVGGPYGRAARRICSTGRATGPGTARPVLRPIPTRASPFPSITAPAFRRRSITRRACPYRASYSAAGGRPRYPSSTEAFDWEHGVFKASANGSETTAAATGQAGVVRRDPMAMLPFCGYNMGGLFRPLPEDRRRPSAPSRRYSSSTGSRRTSKGSFIWPGFRDNSRVIKWMVDRIKGKVQGRQTPVGIMPNYPGPRPCKVSPSAMRL